MQTIDHSIRGNSRAAIAGRAEKCVRQSNAWKVVTGVLTRRQLTKWAHRVARDAVARPEDFAFWPGVVRALPRALPRAAE